MYVLTTFAALAYAAPKEFSVLLECFEEISMVRLQHHNVRLLEVWRFFRVVP